MEKWDAYDRQRKQIGVELVRGKTIPKGIKLANRENFQDSSDASQDRLWTGVGLNSFDEQGQFYYRAND